MKKLCICAHPVQSLAPLMQAATVIKVILTVPLVMALLGAKIELHLAPQLDVVLTTARRLAMWAWLFGEAPAAM